MPVSLRLERARLCCRARVLVVYEVYVVAYEDFVLYLDAFADERVAGNFAVAPDTDAFLNLYERAYLRAVADFAAVQVDEVVYLYVAS